jgi:hypothetical protein
MRKRGTGLIRVAGLAAVISLVVGMGWTRPGWGARRAQDPTRFEFMVVESFDALYPGDTPGHRGRGSLGTAVPNVALGDPVYAGEEQVGHVTRVVWDRTKESLDIEFAPEKKDRIWVGEEVWLSIAPRLK